MYLLCCYCACVKMIGFHFSLVCIIRRDKQSEAAMADRLVNEGQLSWTLICVRFDVMTLLNNIIFTPSIIDKLYIGIPNWSEATQGS